MQMDFFCKNVQMQRHCQEGIEGCISERQA